MEKTHSLDEREMELARLLMADCHTTGDIQAKLKRLFAGTIEQMLEAEMDEHLGYEKNSIEGNNSGNSRNGYTVYFSDPLKVQMWFAYNLLRSLTLFCSFCTAFCFSVTSREM